MKSPLIPSKIKDTTQQKEWNHFWSRPILQKIINLGRHYESTLYINTLFRQKLTGEVFCELGSGTSLLLTKIAKHVKTIIAVDYSNKSLALSKKNFKTLGISNYKLIKADVRNLNLAEKFDVVFSNGLIEHFEDPGKIIEKHVEITRDKGYTIILAPHKYSFKNLWYRLSKLLKNDALWPWTEQQFFSTADMQQAYNKYLASYGYEHSVSYFYLTENVVLVVRKWKK